jgi:hypothetical protein
MTTHPSNDNLEEALEESQVRAKAIYDEAEDDEGVQACDPVVLREYWPGDGAEG